MLNTMTVTNYLGESVVINLRDGEPEHGLIIKEIDGLGPPEAVVNMTDYASDDGSKWNSSRAQRRTIVMTFLLTMAPDIETSRENTYRYFPLKKPVNIVFDTDRRHCETTGYVESNKPNPFTKNAENTITVVCEDPWLYKVGEDEPHKTEFNKIEPAFEFEYSNESTYEKLTEFGRYISYKERVIVYEGDANVGLTMNIQCLTAGVGDLVIYNKTTDETMTIHTDKIASITGTAFSPGDQIEINTVDKTRSAKLLRNGVYTNVLNIIDKSSQWFELVKGENVLVFSASSGHDEYVALTTENRTVYEGI